MAISGKDLGETQFLPRRTWPRSSQACLRCRTRKVRCILMREEPPCVNCLRDGTECLLQESSRHKRAKLSSRHQSLETYSLPTKPEVDKIEDLQETSQKSRITSQKSLPSVVPITRNVQPDPPGSYGVFLKKPAHISIPHARELWRIGAFVVPSTALSSKLVDSFKRWHQPLHPILSSDEIMQISVRKEESLLLLHAFYFVACDTIDEGHLKLEGYKCRTHARYTIFRKAIKLIACQYEANLRQLVQSLYLLSFCEDQTDGPQLVLDLLSVELDSLSLQWYDTGRSASLASDESDRKRIWWLCRARVQELTLYCGKSDISTAVMNQTKILEISDLSGAFEILNDLYSESEREKELGYICLERVELLCRTVTPSLAPARNSPEYSELSNQLHTPASSHISTEDDYPAPHSKSQYLSMDLIDLRNILPPIPKNFGHKWISSHQSAMLELHQCLLHLIYNTRLLTKMLDAGLMLKKYKYLDLSDHEKLMDSSVSETTYILHQIADAGLCQQLPTSITIPLLPVLSAFTSRTEKGAVEGYREGFCRSFDLMKNLPCFRGVSDAHRHMLQMLVSSIPRSLHPEALLCISSHQSPCDDYPAISENSIIVPCVSEGDNIDWKGSPHCDYRKSITVENSHAGDEESSAENLEKLLMEYLGQTPAGEDSSCFEDTKVG